jgi:hypothetical protein
MPQPIAPPSDPDDPGLFSWVLAIGLWAECIVAVVAALRSTDSVAQGVFFALYALGLAVAAVGRSGPLSWMRLATWGALALVALAHLAGWGLALALGRRPPGAVELVVYGAFLAIIAVLTARERALPRDDALAGWPRLFEVVARSVGLAFLAGVLLLIVDGLVRLPFSGH